MLEPLVGTRPEAAVEVCVVLMQVFPLIGIILGFHERDRMQKTMSRPRLPRGIILLLAGYPMAFASYAFWSNPRSAESPAAFLVTVGCCWTWTVLASRWRELIAGAVGIGVWLAVLAAGGISRVALLLVLLTSFAYLYVCHHRASLHSDPQVSGSGRQN